MTILMHVDDFIIVGASMIKIDGIEQSLKDGNENVVLTDKGDIENFLESR